MITLLTDFGTADYFVGAVKGAILSVNPRAVIADITHEIPPQDIEAGAFTLLAAYKTFPAGTIHMAVVDPGVGSTRRPLVVSANEQFFVGPDNGIFSYICDRESSHRTFHITAEKYFRPAPGSTFHGRDIFAPVAAALSNGVKPEELGREIDDEVRLDSLDPLIKNDGKVKARIIHIDRFGNCITNITRDLFQEWENARLLINGKKIREFRNFYGEASRIAPFAIWGSAGFLEISVNGGSAAKILRVKRGDKVVIKD
ncbi:MAG TPA: SAM-dependent chlorinase/fluorinase [Pyrinomonadaceae bacterium]|nr:SAM-dependent chlorinase/fluorinase [Pyrinomonadaceae bacterium]